MATNWTKQSESTAPTWAKQTKNTQEKFGSGFGTAKFGTAKFGTPKDGWVRKSENTASWSNKSESTAPTWAKQSEHQLFVGASANTGATSPSTMTDDNTVGTKAWSFPNRAKVSDAIYTLALLDTNGDISHYLKATNFGFSIPTGATINGIIVEVQRRAQVATITDSEVKIVKSNGSIGTTNKATGTSWPGTEAYASYGSSSDLWDETWAATDINNSNFGMVIAAISGSTTAFNYAEIDHIRITVYYTTENTWTKKSKS